MKNIKKIREIAKDNPEILNALVSEVVSWNGELEHLEVFEFEEEFFNMFFMDKPFEAFRATFFGSVNNWTDEYIRFNAYGNLESLSEYEHNKELIEYQNEILDTVENNLDDLDLDYIFEMESVTK